MDKVKSKKLYSSLLYYLIPFMVICAIGIFIIEIIAEYFENWYLSINTLHYYQQYVEENGLYSYNNLTDNPLVYYCLHYGKIPIIPIWSSFCLWITVRIFYIKEINTPIDILKKSANKILNDDLDFKVESNSSNELGELCTSFETMRKNLYDSNYELWKSLEERKRLNSAFSHDLRTPITVLKGYNELIEKYKESISKERQTDILNKMKNQIQRLESYTEKMNAVQKLEDIIPENNSFFFEYICTVLKDTGKLLCENTDFLFECKGNKDSVLYSDYELILQVFENLISNAIRFRRKTVDCQIILSDEYLKLIISDDGNGFSDEAIRKACQPFYRDNTETETNHFGMGLYICRLLCRKCGGDLKIYNNPQNGGTVCASFFIKKIESR